ncbi:MAG TPA: SRPBCC domain-containing protein [Gemmatimonadales bacterium]
MPTQTNNLIARASITIAATPDKVWQALVTPAAIKQYMFGTTVTSDWKEGSPITWKGEWQGKAYEDKGVIRQVQPGRALQYTHFSPMAGLPDQPENSHTVSVQLSPEDNGTRVSLTQDNNPTEEEREHSEKNWCTMLDGLKEYIEGPS